MTLPAKTHSCSYETSLKVEIHVSAKLFNPSPLTTAMKRVVIAAPQRLMI
jgi:hypothetical protein